MQVIEVAGLKALLRARNDNGVTSSFFDAFGELLSTGDAKPYLDWMYEMFDRRGHLYDITDREGIPSHMISDISMFMDIKHNGMRDPVSIYMEAPYGLEIDGNHRLAAADALGHAYIPFVCADDIAQAICGHLVKEEEDAE